MSVKTFENTDKLLMYYDTANIYAGFFSVFLPVSMQTPVSFQLNGPKHLNELTSDITKTCIKLVH